MAGPLIENKIFVGGLGPHTTSESLSQHFSQYGQAECLVMMDRSTGRSRGFGFCTFQDPKAVAAVLQTVQVVDGKEVECKECLSKESAPPPLVPRNRDEGPSGGSFNRPPAAPRYKQEVHVATEGRIFVGGLPQTCTDEVLLAFCDQFGDVVDCTVMVDQATGRSRGFGYVSFASQESVELILANAAANIIEGKWVEVKRCAPRPAEKEPHPRSFGPPMRTSIPGGGLSKRQREIAELTELLQDPALGLDRFIGPMLQQLRQAAADARQAQASAAAVLAFALPGNGGRGGKGGKGLRYSPY